MTAPVDVAVLGDEPSLCLNLVAQGLVGRLHVLTGVVVHLRGEQPDATREET